MTVKTEFIFSDQRDIDQKPLMQNVHYYSHKIGLRGDFSEQNRASYVVNEALDQRLTKELKKLKVDKFIDLDRHMTRRSIKGKQKKIKVNYFQKPKPKIDNKKITVSEVVQIIKNNEEAFQENMGRKMQAPEHTIIYLIEGIEVEPVLNYGHITLDYQNCKNLYRYSHTTGIRDIDTIIKAFLNEYMASALTTEDTTRINHIKETIEKAKKLVNKEIEISKKPAWDKSNRKEKK